MAFWQKKQATKANNQPVSSTVVSSTTTDQPLTEQKSTTKPVNEATVKKVDGNGRFSHARGVITGPWVTEKATALQAQGQYVFEVLNRANKVQIIQAVKEMYGVIPSKVRVVSTRGKVVRAGRYFGKRRDKKKAVVTLPKGQTIDIYKGV